MCNAENGLISALALCDAIHDAWMSETREKKIRVLQKIKDLIKVLMRRRFDLKVDYFWWMEHSTQSLKCSF